MYANQGDWHGVARVLPRAARPHGSTWPHEKIAGAAPSACEGKARKGAAGGPGFSGRVQLVPGTTSMCAGRCLLVAQQPLEMPRFLQHAFLSGGEVTLAVLKLKVADNLYHLG